MCIMLYVVFEAPSCMKQTCLPSAEYVSKHSWNKINLLNH